jgi:Tfp pilus assembly protein PilP
MRALQTLSLAVFVASATTVLGAQQTKAPARPPKPAPAPVAAKPAPAPVAAKPAPAPVAAKPAPVAAKPAPAPVEAYAYDPAGRRDPFLNLIKAGGGRDQAKKSEGGPAGMSVAEISVRGVMESRGKMVAMVMGPDNKTYVVHQGDKLLDGSIKSITPQGLVIEQEVNDPLSIIKQREIRKLLRGLEDAK